jgi:hypothetical protein
MYFDNLPQRYNIFCINARKWRLFSIFSLEVRGDEAVFAYQSATKGLVMFM